MRVVEPGNTGEAWPRQFRCPHCQALLELDVKDIGRDTDYTGGFNSFFVDCPECLEQPDVPNEWWNTLHRLYR